MVYLIEKLTMVPFTKLFIKDINGIENIPKEGPIIIASNHASFIDDLIIPSVVVPFRDVCFAFYVKASYTRNFFLRKFMSRYGAIPVETGKKEHDKGINNHALTLALKHLSKNNTLMIFPEGTRSVDGNLQKAKTGVATLAVKAKVPVLPFGIEGSTRFLPKGKMFPRFGKSKVNVGKPIYFEEYYDKKLTRNDLENITRRIMKKIAKLIGQDYRY